MGQSQNRQNRRWYITTDNNTSVSTSTTNINNYNFNKICVNQLEYICKKLFIFSGEKIYEKIARSIENFSTCQNFQISKFWHVEKFSIFRAFFSPDFFLPKKNDFFLTNNHGPSSSRGGMNITMPHPKTQLSKCGVYGLWWCVYKTCGRNAGVRHYIILKS